MRLCGSLALSMGFVYNKENTIIICNSFSKEISECEGVYYKGWMNVFPNTPPADVLDKFKNKELSNLAAYLLLYHLQFLLQLLGLFLHHLVPLLQGLVREAVARGARPFGQGPLMPCP